MIDLLLAINNPPSSFAVHSLFEEEHFLLDFVPVDEKSKLDKVPFRKDKAP